MKILHIVSNLDGGTGSAVLTVANEMACDHQLTVIEWASTGLGGERRRREAVKLIQVQRSRKCDPLFWRRLLRVTRAISPDVVHSHDFYSHWCCMALYRLLKIPCFIVSMHGIADAYLGWKKHGQRVLLSQADAVHCVSRASADRANQMVPGIEDKVYIIHNAIEFLPLKPVGSSIGQRIILCTANFHHPAKGQEYLIRSVPMILEREPGAELWLAGDGVRVALCRSLAEELGISDRLRFLGYVADRERLLERADVFVLPSLSESFGIAAAEAMAAEVPVVVSDVGGLRELVNDGVTGIRVPAADPSALAAAILCSLESDSKVQSMTAQARNWVTDNLDSKRISSQFERMYRKAMS